MTQGNYINDEERALERLRSILLKQDRVELEEIRSVLYNQDKLSEKVKPILNSHFEFFKENFSKEYESIVNEIIDKKLKQSEQELLDIIYPSLGKMISKYVALQMTTLKESIENSVKSKFSIGRSLKSFFTGVKESDLIIRDAVVSTVEEIYLIHRDSGILLASASSNESMDREVVAGMFTAIKAFVEDAFNKEGQDLEMIEYGSYKIVIRSYYSYYIAMAISGAISKNEENELANKIDSFASTEMKEFKGRIDNSKEEISNLLETKFIKH